jgi:hypothetical protein
MFVKIVGFTQAFFTPKQVHIRHQHFVRPFIIETPCIQSKKSHTKYFFRGKRRGRTTTVSSNQWFTPPQLLQKTHENICGQMDDLLKNGSFKSGFSVFFCIKQCTCRGVLVNKWSFIWPVHLVWMTARLQQDTFLSWHLAPASEVAGGLTLPFYKGHGLPILKW